MVRSEKVVTQLTLQNYKTVNRGLGSSRLNDHPAQRGGFETDTRGLLYKMLNVTFKRSQESYVFKKQKRRILLRNIGFLAMF